MIETKKDPDAETQSKIRQPGSAGAGPGESKPNRSRSRSRLIGSVVLLVVLAGVGYLIWRIFFAGPHAPESVITLSGRIEGDDSAVAPKTGGRILEIRVREGDSVKAGDTIAVLDDQQIRAREDQARAALAVAEAKAKSAQGQIAVLKEQWQQNNLETQQSKVDAAGRVRQAEAELLAAEADLGEQEAAYQLALFDKEAYTRLAETGAVSERKGKEAASTAAQRAAAVAAAKRRVEASRGALTMTQAMLANPAIRGAGTEAVRKQIAQQQAEVASTTASIEQARAQLAEARANRQDLIVTAPFDGTVTTRAAEPGEVVTSGTAIVTLLDLSKVYLRGFVPEGQIGNVKLEQPARVYLDSNPNQPIDGYVSRIDPEATFTPENTYFRDERVKQVVGVKLQLKGAVGFAKPGMPADGEILITGDEWPKGRRTK
jgi:HlyD family secretion protein